MQLADLFAQYGYLVLLFGSMGEGIPVMLFGGFAAHRGWLQLAPSVIVAGALGNFLAFLLWFTVGRVAGAQLLARRPQWAATVARLGGPVARWGGPLTAVCRFVPGLTTPTVLAVALSPLPVVSFVAWNALGALIWAAALGGAGYLLGDALEVVLGDLEAAEEPIALVLVGAGAVAIIVHLVRRRRARVPPAATHGGDTP